MQVISQPINHQDRFWGALFTKPHLILLPCCNFPYWSSRRLLANHPLDYFDDVGNLRTQTKQSAAWNNQSHRKSPLHCFFQAGRAKPPANAWVEIGEARCEVCK